MLCVGYFTFLSWVGSNRETDYMRTIEAKCLERNNISFSGKKAGMNCDHAIPKKPLHGIVW